MPLIVIGLVPLTIYEKFAGDFGFFFFPPQFLLKVLVWETVEIISLVYL